VARHRDPHRADDRDPVLGGAERQAGFRWITPGSLLAVLLWLIASAAFALYVARFSSYSKTYGALGGVIAFLVWLWITNLVILLGAEFDAELERGRAIAGGHPESKEPYVPLRDDRKLDDRKLDNKVGSEAKSDLR
jgi:membrane protein